MWYLPISEGAPYNLSIFEKISLQKFQNFLLYLIHLPNWNFRSPYQNLIISFFVLSFSLFEKENLPICQFKCITCMVFLGHTWFCRFLSYSSSNKFLNIIIMVPEYIWATTWQTQQNERAPNEDSDQPGHPPSLIRVFAVSSMGS